MADYTPSLYTSTSAITISIPSSADLGTYSVTVSGYSGESTPVYLEVTSAETPYIPDYTLTPTFSTTSETIVVTPANICGDYYLRYTNSTGYTDTLISLSSGGELPPGEDNLDITPLEYDLKTDEFGNQYFSMVPSSAAIGEYDLRVHNYSGFAIADLYVIDSAGRVNTSGTNVTPVMFGLGEPDEIITESSSAVPASYGYENFLFSVPSSAEIGTYKVNISNYSGLTEVSPFYVNDPITNYYYNSDILGVEFITKDFSLNVNSFVDIEKTEIVYDIEPFQAYGSSINNQTTIKTEIISKPISVSPVNKYMPNGWFNYNSQCKANEKKVYDRNLSQMYKQYGVKGKYYTTTYSTTNERVFGEANNRTVTSAYNVSLYYELPPEARKYSKFGLENMDNFIMYLSKMDFQSIIPNYRPQSGDLIYIPYNDTAYEITFCNDTEEQFLNTQHSWRLYVRVYQDNRIRLTAATSATPLSAVVDQPDVMNQNTLIDQEKTTVLYDSIPNSSASYNQSNDQMTREELDSNITKNNPKNPFGNWW